jgi:ABC-type amino acid transport substrate-binding protein
LAVVGGTRLLLSLTLDHSYDTGRLTRMGMLRDRGTPRVFNNLSGEPLPSPATTILDRVISRKALRVGYLDDSLPYAFFNDRNELVGLDVEMALQLARDLGVTLELVPVDRTIFQTGLQPGLCDLVMSGVAITVERASRVQFSNSYLDETVAFVVPDHLAADFSEWSSVRAMRGLRVGVPNALYFIRKVQDEMPDAEIVPIDRIEDMFRPHDRPVDAFVMTAERGSAYTLLHPEYSVTVPKPRPAKVPLAYIVAGRDAGMTSMLNTWIEEKRKDGTIDELFEHWILGQDSAPKKPRWSVIDNLLK